MAATPQQIVSYSLQPDGSRIEQRRMESQEEANVRSIREKVGAAVAQLETYDATWDTLTAAQRLVAQRLSLRVTKLLARLHLGDLAND